MLEKQTRSDVDAKELLLRIADELGVKRDALLQLIKAAGDARRRLVSVERGLDYVKGTFISSEASRKYPEKVVVSRTLEGDLVKHRVGVPLERSYHYAVAGARSMKCTCEFALRVASRADRIIEAIAKKRGLALTETYPFSKRVLCKHTLVLLDELLRTGNVDREVLEKTMKLAVAGYAIAKNEAEPRVINYAMKTLSSKKATQ